MSDFIIKDSGVREESATGAVRDTEDGKGRYDLLPPEAILALARHYQGGAKKYSARNWEKGAKFSRTVSSMLRHAFQYLQGDRTEDHLAAVMWNAAALKTYEERIKEGILPADLMDLPWREKFLAEADSPHRTTLPPGPVWEIVKRVDPKPRAAIMPDDQTGLKNPAPQPTRKLLYVAGKFTDPRGQWYQEQHARLGEEIAAKLWEWGYGVISPHANTRYLGGVTDWHGFMEGDLVMVERSDGVVMAPNWRDSKGATAEHNHAQAKGIPVYYWNADLAKSSPETVQSTLKRLLEKQVVEVRRGLKLKADPPGGYLVEK